MRFCECGQVYISEVFVGTAAESIYTKTMKETEKWFKVVTGKFRM